MASKLETPKQGRPGKDTNRQVKRDEAAALLNVSERNVARAAKVRDHGPPDVPKAVERGEVAVSAAAEFLKQPAENLIKP